ncbi:chemotaxis protein CheA [uncultured Salinisphaera sp.]|uniref:chemotaxis protein CheA n=1 Tax=uncultured Salinisphaera sp. TaxID=359372 RepID=UPI0032B19ADD
MTLDIAEFYQTFFDEADELLDEMERLLINLDIDAPDSEDLNAIFRAAHSIKGGAGTFGFTHLQETTHLLENLLDRARHGELVLDRAAIDLFLECRDVLAGQIDAYRAAEEPDQNAYEDMAQRLRTLDEQGSAALANAASAVDKPVGDVAPAGPVALPEGMVRSVSISGIAEDKCSTLVEELGLFGDIESQTYEGDTLTVMLAQPAAADDIESVLCFIIDAEQLSFGAAEAVVADSAESDDTHAEDVVAQAVSEAVAAERDNKPQDKASASEDKAPAAAPAAAGKPKAANKSSAESSSLRVSTEKVDEIINLVGELVITQSMLEQTIGGLDSEAHGALLEGLNQLQRNARDLQEAVMSVRMMPMDYAFNRFPRLVRDLSSKLGKQINLVTEGESTELDKGLIERIMDPMTHLVRNSLDHGIETPERRKAAGKPAAGTLTLAAQHQGGSILIDISDDGAGLNRERILAKARQNGLAVSDSMSDDEVWQLIFAPGFSTAEAVTDVSGRGVGMDVVKRNIQELGGHVDIRSTFGQGTTIRIVLPLTLAIMDGMLIRVGEEVFIMPLGAIKESMQVQADQLKRVGQDKQLVYVRGEYLPLVEMHRVFDIDNAQSDVLRGIVMVIESEGRYFTLLVDELLGQRQVVVKNLETNYRKVVGISAATILGDGSVALILDVVALSRAGRQSETQVQRAALA